MRHFTVEVAIDDEDKVVSMLKQSKIDIRSRSQNMFDYKIQYAKVKFDCVCANSRYEEFVKMAKDDIAVIIISE